MDHDDRLYTRLRDGLQFLQQRAMRLKVGVEEEEDGLPGRFDRLTARGHHGGAIPKLRSDSRSSLRKTALRDP